ncbi:tail fiber protein [Photorhabdus sp. SF281]|uniref:tail fiber protein n=1 Tax=Photorhabdus sp. SF281 TaxID=3459527 RepID=UPI004043B5E4
MAKNEFLTFGIAEGANVLSNEEYAALAARVNGFSAGVAKSRELNKAWRQSSIITHILADFIAKESGNDVLDDGNIDALKSNMALAIKNALPEVRDATLTEKGIIQLSNATDSTSERLAATPRAVKYAYDLASTANTSATNANNNANTKLSKSQNGADIPDKNAFVKNLGLAETVSKANNAVPNSRRINGKVLTGDISLSAGDVGAFKLGLTGSVPNSDDVPWNANTGLYAVQGIKYSSHIAHFNNDTGSCPAFQLKVQYDNSGLFYRSALNHYGFKEDWSELATLDNIVPVGVPLPYPHRYTPPGYLTCNGQTFDKSLYPKLAEAYPAGRVPDLRGEFIRGWDDGRGVDSGRGILSWQPQQVQWHQHIGGHGGRAQGAFGVTNQAGHPGSYNDDSQQTLPFTNNGGDYQGLTNNGAVGNETRPRSVAFNYIVRAA